MCGICKIKFHRNGGARRQVKYRMEENVLEAKQRKVRAGFYVDSF